MSGIYDRINKLTERKKRLISYLKLKVGMQDWHAVWDAACEIGGLEDTIKELEAVWTSDVQELSNKSTAYSTKETEPQVSRYTQTGVITASVVLPPGSVQT